MVVMVLANASTLSTLILMSDTFDILVDFQCHEADAHVGLDALMREVEHGRVDQQVQNYKTCLKNSHFGVEKFNFSLGLSFNFFCIDIILLSV